MDNSFDGIYSNKVLHHLNNEELQNSIIQQHSILNQNSVICHSFWNGEGSEVFKGLFVNYHTIEDLKGFFKESFELVYLKTYKEFEEIGAILEVILLETAKKYNVDLVVNRFGSMMNPFFTKTPVTNFEEAQTSDTKKFAVFFWEMIKNGVFLPPSQFEAWFLNSAISDKDIKVIAEAVDKAMQKVSEI